MINLPLIYHGGTRTAAKKYICCECGIEIKPGEQYFCFNGLYDDGWETYRRCVPCEKLAERIDVDCNEDEGTPFKGLSVAAKEAGRDDLGITEEWKAICNRVSQEEE